MANFKTHIIVASSISGIVASTLLLAGLATKQATLLYWLLGTVGGILPDIDSKQSVPARLLFIGLGIFFACLTVLSQLKQLSLLTLLGLWCAVFLVFRYVLFAVFNALTVHRGNFHSILGALTFGLLIAVLAYRWYGVSTVVAWFSGFFVAFGYLIHLILDELYSVDLSNKRLKKSFGSAFKLVSKRYKVGAVFFLAAIIILIQLAPSTQATLKLLSQEQTYIKMKAKLLP